MGVLPLSASMHAFLLPNGGLSQKLGLFMYDMAVLHCLFFSTRSMNFCNERLPQPQRLDMNKV